MSLAQECPTQKAKRQHVKEVTPMIKEALSAAYIKGYNAAANGDPPDKEYVD